MVRTRALQVFETPDTESLQDLQRESCAGLRIVQGVVVLVEGDAYFLRDRVELVIGNPGPRDLAQLQRAPE